MKEEKSCGCIIVDDEKILLILSKSDNGSVFWSFPKGHQEHKETDLETALREVKEETNLDVVIVDDEPIITNHLVKNGTANKRVLLFIAKLIKDEQQIQAQKNEVEDIEWVKFDKVDEYLNQSFDYYRDSWREAKRRLKYL